jgi:hypothetical protein
MIVKSKGIKTDLYYIPPFELRDGELVVIYLYGGAHYYDLKTELGDIFTGKTRNDNVNIFRPLTFVEHFKESTFRRLFYPVTVGEYLNKNANSKNNFATKIYDIDWISKKTKVNTLAGNTRKLLCLYSTLSYTSDIVFDLAGQDPQGALETYKLVKDTIRNGGSGILIDWADDMKDDCTKFITIEWTEK